jgi:hypothetical protein
MDFARSCWAKGSGTLGMLVSVRVDKTVDILKVLTVSGDLARPANSLAMTVNGAESRR